MADEVAEKQAFEIALGQAVVAWNRVEYAFREFVAYTVDDFRGASTRAWIAVASMGSRHLGEVLASYAYSILADPDEKAHVQHVNLLYAKWLGHRNAYFHGIKS